MLPVVILCGGLSTRLQPLTETIPKSMVTVLGKPFIDWQLSLLKENGCKEVILCIGKFGDQIRDHIGSGLRCGIHVQYSDDSGQLLGTGGALQNAYRILPSEFIVMNGDIYVDINYRKLTNHYFCENTLLLMTVYPANGTNIMGNVSINNNKLQKYDKSGTGQDLNYVDFGITVMKRRLLNRFPVGDTFDFGVIYSNLIEHQQASYYVSSTPLHEIGSPDGLRETEEYLTTKQGQ